MSTQCRLKINYTAIQVLLTRKASKKPFKMSNFYPYNWHDTGTQVISRTCKSLGCRKQMIEQIRGGVGYLPVLPFFAAEGYYPTAGF